MAVFVIFAMTCDHCLRVGSAPPSSHETTRT